MKNEIKRVWAVFATNDEYGRYDEVDDLMGVYEYKTDADREAKGQGWYGGEGHVTQRTAVRCGNKWYITTNPLPVKLNVKHVDERKSLREQALKKLTVKEKAALGVSD